MTPLPARPYGAYPDKVPEGLDLTFPEGKTISDLCKRWKIRELAVFGEHLVCPTPAAVGVEVLVRFTGSSCWTLGELTRLEDQFRGLFGRPCHLIEGVTADLHPVYRQQSRRTGHVLFRGL